MLMCQQEAFIKAGGICCPQGRNPNEGEELPWWRLKGQIDKRHQSQKPNKRGKKECQRSEKQEGFY